jgi:hypothetical protein
VDKLIARAARSLPLVVLTITAGCAIAAVSPAGTPGRAGGRSLPTGTASSRVVQPQRPPGSCRARDAGRFALPDPRCTPGAVSPAVTPADLDATICSHGYTARVRPPEAVTEPEKLASMAAYGDRGSPRRYEYDHLVPLELGGAGNDPRNLWPEPGASPNPKDTVERVLRSMVCERRLSLRAAQEEIAGDWAATYRRLLG